MKAMKRRVAKFSPVVPFRNLYITGSVTAVTSLPIFTGIINTSVVESVITNDQGGVGAISDYIAGALVILVAIGLVYSMLHKAQRVLWSVWLGAFFTGASIIGHWIGESF